MAITARDIKDAQAYHAFVEIMARKHGASVFQASLKALTDTCFDSWGDRPCPPDYTKAAENLQAKYHDDWGT